MDAQVNWQPSQKLTFPDPKGGNVNCRILETLHPGASRARVCNAIALNLGALVFTAAVVVSSSSCNLVAYLSSERLCFASGRGRRERECVEMCNRGVGRASRLVCPLFLLFLLRLFIALLNLFVSPFLAAKAAAEARPEEEEESGGAAVGREKQP